MNAPKRLIQIVIAVLTLASFVILPLAPAVAQSWPVADLADGTVPQLVEAGDAVSRSSFIGPPESEGGSRDSADPLWLTPKLTDHQTNFTVTQVYPPNASFNVVPNTVVSASFSLPVDFSTVSTRTFTVRGLETGVYAGTYTTGSVRFDAAQRFKPGEEVVVNLSNGLQAQDGTPLTPYAWSFWAAALGGSGVFTDSGQSLGDREGRKMKMGDLDGDGDLDALVWNSSSQDNRVWLNDGTGVFSDSGQSLGGYAAGGVLGDVDSDGDLDAFVGMGTDTLPGGLPNQVWLNDGAGVFTDSGQSLGNSRSGSVSLGDVDGDGDLDAFVPNRLQGNRVWLNDGIGIFSDSGQSLGSSKSSGLVLGDVDGDGDLDAFEANSNQANKVWLNDGTGIFSDSGQSLGSSNSEGLSLGDLDGDGDIDAFVPNWSDQANKVWWNNGAGVFTDSGQALGSSNSHNVDLGDVDGDGDLDAFVANTGQANRVWLNDGTGIFSDSSQSLGSGSSTDVALGDLDGDGDLDAFVVNRNGQGNRVWLNQGGSRMTVDKWATPDPVWAGSALTYTLWVTNRGTLSLTTTITDVLPAQVTPTGVLTWTAQIPPGGLWSQTLAVTVESGFAGELTNVLQVTTDEGPSAAVSATVTAAVAIAGLEATSDSPTVLGNPTTLTATITAGSDVSYTWHLGDGTGVTQTYPSPSGLGLTVPDNGCGSNDYLEHTINVPDWGLVLDVDVTVFDLRHQWDADLYIYLRGPEGTEVELSTANGGEGDNYYNTIFDDEAAIPITAGTPPFTGRFQPEGILAAFDGREQQGDWTLRLCDTGPTIEGTLNEWSLTITQLTLGDTITHTYPSVGVYTATVIAKNPVSLLTATTTVIVEEAIAGLTAFNDGSTILGDSTTLTATITAGSNVSYTWAFGDGDDGSGAVLSHTYLAVGVYTAVVTTSNSVSLFTATTVVTVTEAMYYIYLPLVFRNH